MARSPGLLAADLTERDRLQPMSGSLTTKLVGAGDAELTLPEGGPAVNIHDLISIYTDKGLAGIYRVTNVSQNFKRQIDLSMLHAIDILSDSVWTDQTDFEGTRAQYITALLNQQTTLINGVKPWTLGTCADNGTVKKSINYDRLSDLLQEMEEDGGQFYFTYDFSTYPWVLNYLEKPQNTASEFRLARNVRTATVTYNDADLCTRLHLSVNVEKTVGTGDNATTETETKIKTYNNTEAQETWGIVVKTADIDTGDDLTQETLPEADAWAAAFLFRRQEPSVQIQIDGDELKAMTGDTWDEYTIGKLCQVALPDYGRSFQERVVSVTYPDLYKDPGHVTVSLANNLPKFSESLTDARKKADQAQKKATTVGRGAAKAKDLTTWSQIVTYQGAALDGSGVMTLWQSGIDMDAQGGVRIFSLQEGLQALYAGIEVTASQIRAEVSQGLSGMHSELLMTASQIKAEVDDSLSGIASFVIQADQIRSEVQDALSNLGTLVVEASQIRAEVRNALSDFAEFKVEASQIRAEVSDALSRVATLEITASQIRQEVEDAEGNMAQMLVTASQIRGEVLDAAGNVSTWVQTASQIKGEITDAANNVSTWVQTASQIKGEIMDASNNVSTWVQEASQIRGEVFDETNGLRAQIQANAGRIGLVVNSNNTVKGSVIVQAINGQSEAMIDADKITLGGSTTVAGVLSVTGDALYVSKDAVFRGNVSVLSGGTLAAPSLQLVGTGTYRDLTAENTGGLITELQIAQSGNVYTLQKKTLSSDTWTDVASFNRGSAAEISGAWSGATYTATAAGSTPVTTTVGMTGAGQQDSFTVSAFHDGVTTATVNSINGYLVITSSSTRANNKAEVRLNAKTGTSSVLVSSLSLGDVFDKGADAVTLSGAWSGATYTAMASNGKTASTTIGLTVNGQNDSFTFGAYQGSSSANTVKTANGYLVITSSSTRADNTAEVRINARTGTSSILVSSVGLGDVYDRGAAAVTLSRAISGNLVRVNASNGQYSNTYINLNPSGNGSDNFSVSAYYGTDTNNTLITRNVYLIENTSSKRVEAHWNRADGSVYANVSTTATYNAGVSSVTLSRTITGNHIQVDASNGKQSNTYVNLTPSGQGQTSFTVSAYYGSDTNNTLISRYIYLTETASSTRSKCKVQARWNSATGTVYGEIPTADTYDAGKNSVTISAAWNGAKYTVTPSNGKTPASTTIGLTPSGSGQTSFTVSAYHDSTSSTIKSEYIYLVDNSSQKRVEARWGSASGSVYAQCSYTSTSHSITCRDVGPWPGSTPTGSRTKAASISRPPANGYVFFTIDCGNATKQYYISIGT